ncbi:MAG: hypothetical protein K0Q49_2607 [Haloplasmataceae bacterium]|nr:hypothetical protein [Haloplasmataceae bacterium]
MLDNKFIDVDYTDIEKEVFLTAPDVAREIPADEKRVRYWGDTFGRTIKAFKVIQKLIDEKQFTHAQVRDYIIKNGFEQIGDNENDLSKDLIGYNGLSSEISVEIEQRLNSFEENIKKMLFEYGDFLKDDVKEQVALTVDEVVSDHINLFKSDITQNIKEELNIHKDENKKISEEIKEQIDIRFNQLDRNSEERDLKLVEKLRDDTKDEKIKALEKEIEELKSQKQTGFFSKLFGKKK